MISIDDSRIPRELLQQRFSCDVVQCKGQCCKDGSTGAPLLQDEIPIIESGLDQITKRLDDTAKEQIKRSGWHQGFVRVSADGPSHHPDGNIFEGVSIRDDQVCVFGIVDDEGIASCAIERAYEAGEIGLQKPAVCHLYPLRIFRAKDGDTEEWASSPREICSTATTNGEKLGVSLIEFLESAIVRVKGEDFYRRLQVEVDKARKQEPEKTGLVQIR